MELFYKVQYLIGLTPWERLHDLPAAEQARALFDAEEAGRRPPYGRALDLGCGSGIWSVELARRGWEVTGVDVVAKAIRRARARAREADVDIRFLEGSVTALRAAGVGTGFQFVIDFGVLHGMKKEQREAAAREVTAAAADDATLLMYAVAPGRRGPLPRGVSREELEAAYAGWTIVQDETFDVSGLPNVMKKAQPRWYRLRRDETLAQPTGA